MRRTKSTTMKRITSFLLSAAMLLTSVQSVFAVTVGSFTDFPTGWSRPAMEAAVNNGLLVGFENNEIRPRNNLTRAEMAAIMSRAFGAITMADISAYKDVAYDAWYYEYIAKAVQMGAMTGKSATEMCPDCNITREEAFSIIGRILALSEADTSVLSKFNDAANVSSWAVGNIAALVKRGYVNGDDLGNLNPKANITREEFAQVMYTTIKRYITEVGTYSEEMQGIVVLRTGNINLTSMVVNGDLVVGDGAMKLAVKLDNVTVNGRFLTRGGTMTLKNTSVSDGVVVLNPNGITHFNNYRTEAVFAGINEITRASFLSGTTIKTGGSSGGSSGIRYYVTFKLDEDDTEDYAKIRILRGGKIGDNMPDDPSKVGYNFEGWYDEEGGEVDENTVVTGPLNVTALFTPIDYDIAFKNEDGTPFSYFTSLPVNKFNIETPYEFDLSIVHRTGYDFLGWFNEDGSPAVVEVTEDTPPEGISVYGKFQIINYPVNYKNDDGTLFSYFIDGYQPEDPTFNIENYGEYEHPAPDKVYRKGYSFNGWVKEDGSPAIIVEVTDETTGLDAYADFTLNRYALFYDAEFLNGDDGRTVYYTINDYNTIVLPGPDELVIPDDKEAFLGWYIGDKEITSLDESFITDEVGTITLTPKFSDKGVTPPQPEDEYAVTFKLNAGDTDNYAEFTVEEGTAIGDKMPADPEKLGYSFMGWFDAAGTKIEASTEVFGEINAVARFQIINYPVNYKNEDGTPFSYFINGYQPEDPTFNIENYGEYEHPATDKVYRKGYSFNGWVKADGSPAIVEVTEETTDAGLDVYADFTINEYTIRFEAEFADGSSYKEEKYTIENYGRVVFPGEDELIIPDGKESFLGWYLGDKLITSLDESFITDEEGTITLVAEFTDEQTIKVTFYNGYGKYAIMLDPVISLVVNSEGIATMTDEKMPSYPAVTEVFKKNKYMASNYPDYNGNLEVTPTFWYEVDGKLIPFETPIELTEDTDVHLMYQKFAVNADITELPAVAISALYNDNTRVMDSAKVLGDGAFNWLNQAKTFPKYNEIVDLGIGALVDKDIMDENRNLKMLYLPIKISQFTTEEVANGMVRTRIREMIAHPETLDELLEFAHIDELIQYIDKDKVITGLTNDQILALIQAEENREMVTNFIISDLQKNDSALMDTVLDYISSSLATDAELRGKLVAQVKAKIAENSDSGKKLRQMILKSDSITLLLSNPAIEAKVVDMILDTNSGLIDVILADKTLAKELVEEVSHYPKFVDEIVKTEQFKNYVIPLIQVGGAEYHNVTETILNSDTAKREILDAVEESDDFKNLVKNNAAVRNEILSSITVDYAIDIDDVVKFVFEIDGATDYSTVVDSAVVDTYFDTIPGFDMAVAMYGSRKAAKNVLYDDLDVRATVKGKIVDEYGDDIDEYVADYIANNKEAILDTFIDDKDSLDAAVLTVIENKMIDFVKRYVDKDTTLNASIAAVIEADILAYISDMITGSVPADPDLAEVKARLDADMSEFIANAHENPQIVQVIKNFIDSHHDDEMAEIVDSVYLDFVPAIASYIKGLDVTSANYTTIDATLMNAASTIDEGILSDFIKANSSNADILAILEQYIADPANEDDIMGYVDTFIDTLNISFVTTYRNLIDDMLKSLDLEKIIGDDEEKFIELIKDYIKALDDNGKKNLADEIYLAISATEEYKTLIEHMFEMDEIVITPDDIPYVTAISHAIRDLSVAEAIEFTHNAYIEKLVDLIGEDFITERFNETRDHYCDGLDEVIETVESGASNYETYTTALRFRVNPVEDVLIKLYDKALPIAEEKLINANIYYEDNDYLQYIVEHDVIGRLVTGDGVVNGEYIGYAIKDEAEYAKYVMEMLIAADDALCWYGDEANLTSEQVDAIYDAIVLKAQIVHEKLNEVLEEYMATGDLPDKAEQLITKVQKINDLFIKYESKLREVIDKYLAHSINDKIQDGSIFEDERVLTAVDILIGRDDPVFTIDCLYDIFYKYDDKAQAKLKELIDSGKLRAAIDKALEKAKSTDAITDRVDAEKFDKLEAMADELYAILENVANNGVDYYKVNVDSDPTIIDKYELKFRGNVFTMTRSLQ